MNRSLLLALLLVGCSSPDFEGGHRDRHPSTVIRPPPTPGGGFNMPQWHCHYGFIPGFGCGPCANDTVIYKIFVTVAPNAQEANLNFWAFGWNTLRATPGAAEYYGRLVDGPECVEVPR